MDGNVKSEKADVLTFLDGDGGPAHFVDNGNGRNIPDKIQFPVTTRNGSAPWPKTMVKY